MQEIFILADDGVPIRGGVIPDLAIGRLIEFNFADVLARRPLCFKVPRESRRKLVVDEKFHADCNTT